MRSPSSLLLARRRALRRVALLSAANWPVVLIDSAAESLCMLAIDVLPGV